MRKTPPFIWLAPCLLSSCATIMNQQTTDIVIHTTKPATITARTIPYRTARNRVQISVPRSSKPLTITATTTDSARSTKTVTVRARNSFAFYANILWTYGIGMIRDWNEPKRYGYPRHIYLDLSDSAVRYRTYENRPDYNGQLHLQLSFTYPNIFLLKPYQETLKTNVSFFGMMAGLDYYHRKNQFINVTAAAASSFPYGAPLPFERFGNYEVDYTRSAYLSISNNHHIGAFTMGYGLSYAHDTWEHFSHSRDSLFVPTHAPGVKKNNAVGLVFSTYFYPSPMFRAGIVYRPTFYSFGHVDGYQYQHLITIDFGVKLKLLTLKRPSATRTPAASGK